jgi:hypothetical protein
MHRHLLASVFVVAGTLPAASATIYWNLFNIEGEGDQSAQYVTYTSLDDMLLDSNRTGMFTPNSLGFGRNIVGSGSDGSTYWNLFNIEGESNQSAQYVTYTSLDDMLLDSNRTGMFTPNSLGFGRNIVGSGAFSEVIPTPIPLPAGFWLLAGAIGAFFGVRLRQKDRRVPECH